MSTVEGSGSATADPPDEAQQGLNEGNATAVEAISERLAEVTALAEQLDMALRGAQEDCALSSAAPVSPSIKKIFDGTAATSEDWGASSKKNGDDTADEDFVTASECTYPQSRSSSFNTASECGHYSPWWDLDKSEINEDISKEKMVLAVGCPDLPAAKTVLHPSPECPPGKIVHEVTETTHIKVQHSHTLGVSSFVLTSETVRDAKAEKGLIAKECALKEQVSDKETSTADAEVDDDSEFMKRLEESGDWIQLKILEVQPELTALGETLEEALELQKAHDEVLLQLQSKQSPVEELLRQADQLISTQRPRAEVYAAMAESLGRAWRDVNTHLEHRKQVLDLNVLYKERESHFFERCDVLDEACRDVVVPVEVDAVRAALTNVHEVRRAVLEGLMAALQAGNQLLAKLEELGAEGSVDSRPDRIRVSVNKAISQVERWLNNLHVRRQVLELSWQTRKQQLEQCLALALLAKDLKELEMAVAEKRDLLKNTNQLGDSSSSADLLLHEHKKLLSEARQLQERALKLTKATEQLAATDCFAGEEATAQSYAVLASTSDYLAELDARESLLEKAIVFFKQAAEAFSQLNQLEFELSTTDLPAISSKLAALHAECSRKIEEITTPPLHEGHDLLNTAGRGTSGVDGVERTVAELEDRKVTLQAMCTAHREENLRIARALSEFLETHATLYNWLVEIAERFLLDHSHMGNDLHSAKEFMDQHNRLLNDLQTKGNEINTLLLTLPPILEFLDDPQRHDVDTKVESLHHKWLDLKNALENRLDLGAVYVRFHTEADTISDEMDNLEESLRTCPDEQKDVMLDTLEERWSQLLPLYQQAKNTGLNFLSQSSQAVEPRLDVGRARRCVESTLERLAGRQLLVTRSWQSFRTDVVERRELLVQWQTTMTESKQTINWVTKLDAQLYPIITTPASNPRDIANDLESKLSVVLGEIKKAQSEVEQRIRTTESLTEKTHQRDEESMNIKNKLHELGDNLMKVITDYQVLLEMMVSYFRNLADLDRTMDAANREYFDHNLPSDLYEMESKIREHDANRQAILEMFKFTQNECEPIISRIKKQEPPSAGEHDIQRLLYTIDERKKTWEGRWTDRKHYLEQHLQLCQFNGDLHQINETLDDLSRQLSDVKGQYGESLSAAKATSVAFVYFEKTIELLEQKIEAFLNTGEQMLAQEHSPHIEREIKLLKDRWESFKKQVIDTRRLIDLSILYFQLVEEADEWFREGSKLLVSIARKSTAVKKPEEATELLNEVDMFLKPGEEKQSERIKKIQNLAFEIYGIDKSKVKQVVVENKEMLDSFTAISNELSTLAKNLRLAEEEQVRLQKEREEAEAKLAAAKAEAEAAERATAAAEEARRVAEAAARALEEETARKAAEAAARALEEEKARKALEEERIRKIHEEEERIRRTLEEERIRKTIEEERIRKTIEEERIRKTIEEETMRREIIHKIEISQMDAQPLPSREEEVILPEQKVIEVEMPSPTPPIFVVPLTDAVIQEGSRFTFECQVVGYPTPVVTWHKDGMSIQNNPDYQTTFDQGLCTLTIEETFAEDSARYTCKAINAAGTAETAAVLSVKETEPEEQLAPPTFVRILEPGTAKEGGTFRFECRVEGNPLPTVQWYKNHDCIDSSPDFITTYNNGDAVLKFEEVFLEDKAEYTCKAANELGTAQTTASLSVEPLEPTIGPEFVIPLSNVMARAGKKLKLECQVSGLPQPIITWCHNSKPVRESHDLKLQSEGDRSCLVIREAFPKDAGTYVATATNSAGTATSACNVAVKGRMPTETSDSELASDVEPVRPSIQASLHDTQVREGDRARLDCVIVGQPEPEVIWYRDGRPVKESSDFQLLFQGDRCSLVIQEALLEDAGEYRVVAINSAGEASSSCRLAVVAAEPAAPAGSPPKFDRLLTDVLAAEGDKVILECSVGGEPAPEVRWLLNNQPVSDDGRVRLAYDADGSARLEIEHVSADDRGVYTVKATNSVGEAKCFSQLIVKSARAAEPARAAPAFLEPLADRVCFEQQSVRFECLVSGRPAPSVRWLFQGHPVTASEFIVSTEGERQVLTIPEVAERHQGRITCVAENEVGEASNEAFLSVQALSVVTLPDMEPTEKQSSESYSMRREVFVQQSSSSKVISSSSSSISGAEPQIQVHSVVQQDQQSFKKIGDEAPVIKEAHRLEEYHQVNKEPAMVSEKTVTKVTTGKEIKEGVSLIPRPVRKTTAPRFVSPVVGKIVDQGVDVTLEGILDGYPTPEVSWSKNGSPLEPSDRVTISWELNHAKITLKSVGVKDAGKYTCTAVNEAGSAVSTTDLVVKKTVFPPVFGRRLQAQVVKKGDRLIMEVEVTGTPEPTVTWHKDDMPIEDVLKDGYRSKCQGNCHTFIVDKAALSQTGKYMVRAVNSGGEARSIADIAVFEPTPDTMVEVVKTVVYEDVQKQEIMKPAETKTPEPTPIPVTVEIPITILPEPKPVSPIPVDVSSSNQFSTVSQSISQSVSQSISQSISQSTTKFTLQHTSLPFEEIKPVEPLKIEAPKVAPEPSQAREIPIAIEEPQKKEEAVPLLREVEEPIIVPVKVTMPEPALPKKAPPKPPAPEPIPVVETHQNVQVETMPETVSTVEETGIETSSISKKSSLDFFVSKMKEGDKPPEPKIVETQKIAPEIFTKFQEPKTVEIPVQKEFEYFPPPEIQQDTKSLIEKFEHKPAVSDVIKEETKFFSSSSTQEFKSFSSSQSQMFEEFNLTPEPPPEIGYIPKAEGVKKREDVSVRVKKLAEIHRDLSPMEVPIGGIRLFPCPSPKLEKKEMTPTKIEPPKLEVKKERIIPVTEEKKEVIEEVCVRKQSDRRESQEYNKPIISPVETNYWAPVSFQAETVKVTEPPPVFRPQAEISTRPLSPRPSAEGVKMEKLWAQQRPITPEPPKQPEIVKVASPLPSLQDFTVQKQWSSSQKVEKIVEKSSKSHSSSGPSQEGKNMEKIWAHKHSDSHVKKWWPPAANEEQQPLQQKNLQSYVHKPWTPEKQDTVTKQEVHTVKESVIQSTEYPTLEKQWKPVESKQETKEVRTILQEPTIQTVQTTIEKQWKPEIKSEYTKEVKTIKTQEPVIEKKSLIESHWKPVQPVISSPVQHYVSESRVSHSNNLCQQMSQTSQMSQSFTKTENVEFKSEVRSENIIEEHHKASEIIKSWPPGPLAKEEPALKAPGIVKEATPKIDLNIRPISVQDITDEVYLEPGPPPEIGYAEAPRERRQSYVETIEQDLEKNLDKEPTRVLPGSVRTIPPPREKSLSREKSLPREKPYAPPPLPPKKEALPQAPPLPSRPTKQELKKIPTDVDNKPFERFPDLEPFPYKPDPETARSPRPPPPPTPSKFIKGKFGDSDYESDIDAVKIPRKWKPCQSDTDEPGFRKVKPPRQSPVARSRSTEPEPVPPSKFERPLSVQGPPRPLVDLESTKKELRREITVQKIKETKREVKQSPVIPQPELKPGSPPIFINPEPPKVQPESHKQKPDSPKTKHKVYAESGYMADTDEPLTLQRRAMKSEYHRSEESSRTETKHIHTMSSEMMQNMQKFTVESSHAHHIPGKTHHHRHEHRKHASTTASSKKELVAPVVSITNQKVIQKEDRDSSLEPFPYKPEPSRPKRAKGPPPPSPSKFVKGEWKESDYESDYDGRIPPVWKPSEADGDPSYKPVRPVLTPSGRHSRTDARTPTPPTEFDNPPQMEYPPRPKFEPIEKPKQTVKLDEILKPSPKAQVVFKPKPLPAKPQVMETIIATPAIKPGSPPEMGFAPPRTTQYYRSISSQPYHNATQTETSNIVHFDESTAKSHRTVSVEHTTRIIKFGEQNSHTEHVKRSSGPPPPTPKKFIPGEFRESDYESEVENARIKPKWAPGYNDSDVPQYKKVAAPMVRPSSVPIMRERVITPMEFDKQPPMTTTSTTYSARDTTDGSVKRITKRFGETQSTQLVKQAKTYQSNDVQLHPGSPPEYAFSPIKVPVQKAKEIASQHMEDMTHSFKSKTQKFVNDIMTDMKAPQKPILKQTAETDRDAQAYREESRVAQYGTKHIDPDTGLIYFKYDFGYEFGVVLPGQSRNGEIPQPRKTIIQPPKRTADIELPVQHETTKQPDATNHKSNAVPQFRGGKNVKWEPTSESEMSEIEGDSQRKKRFACPPADAHRLHAGNARWDQRSTSPLSLSPSLPSTSPAFINAPFGGTSWSSPSKSGRGRGAETPPSTPSTPGSTNQHHMNSGQPKKAPLFITPLRDIAVVSGQTARFECIVQSEPTPSILWSKNGRIIENSNDYQIQYRNGVCRLTIPQAFPEDAGTFVCTATNLVGAANSTATLQVPGVPSHMYGTYRQLHTGSSPSYRETSPTQNYSYTDGKSTI